MVNSFARHSQFALIGRSMVSIIFDIFPHKSLKRWSHHFHATTLRTRGDGQQAVRRTNASYDQYLVASNVRGDGLPRSSLARFPSSAAGKITYCFVLPTVVRHLFPSLFKKCPKPTFAAMRVAKQPHTGDRNALPMSLNSIANDSVESLLQRMNV